MSSVAAGWGRRFLDSLDRIYRAIREPREPSLNAMAALNVAARVEVTNVPAPVAGTLLAKADNSRVYLGIVCPVGAADAVSPFGPDRMISGYPILANEALEFTIATHPSLVACDWYWNTGPAGNATVVEILAPNVPR